MGKNDTTPKKYIRVVNVEEKLKLLEQKEKSKPNEDVNEKDQDDDDEENEQVLKPCHSREFSFYFNLLFF